MGFPSPASDYVESRIDLNKVCSFGGPSVRIFTAEHYHGEHINSGTMLLVDSAIKPVDGHILLILLDGKHEVYRLVTIVRRGLEEFAPPRQWRIGLITIFPCRSAA
ncbi:DNA polymerase V [Rahnella aquatilis]|nr:DNA polymerase V [Rahnella aquatilis]